MATSAALVERTVRSSSSPPAPSASPDVPKPLKKTLPIERFMASAICLVRMEPEAPTSMPATMSAVLSSATPAAAALRPVKALSVEITTGMSAPPIGSAAADAVEQRHHLRHRGHLHAPGAGDPDRRADRDAGHDQPPVADPLVQQ